MISRTQYYLRHRPRAAANRVWRAGVDDDDDSMTVLDAGIHPLLA